MVSSCLEANKSMAHSELIQVWGTVPSCALGALPCPGDPTVPLSPRVPPELPQLWELP